ncbi:restriction endonuclease [Shewanella benthica]|uniref:Restriction endonuclease type IV Mrr domain-containing protein n=1 Tax=Shewanella benthica KT99 TaxID=314608 RepID=A9CZP3_9GAMM|nr:restriction endonuclease [Shewanella benthica]EDQ02027.1 hypothetical protein KT99_19544 [Shewanella benthica KT99]
MTNIVLVRSPHELVAQNFAGYGWEYIDFSSFVTFSNLMEHVTGQGIDTGRRRNQMSRFFHIKEGDIVVVPVHRAIVIGVATGEKGYQHEGGYGSNRVVVNYFTDEQGEAITIPRAKLTQGLESRLKIRMTVISLNEFEEEITTYVDQLLENNKVCFDSLFQQKRDLAVSVFKEQLLSNLRTGATTLKSGGYGLEELIKELMEIEGYTASIAAKNSTSDISDVDIIASRIDPVSNNRVYIQAKHHSGITSDWGIKQLAAIEEDEHIDKWLITTGCVSEDTKEIAKQENISIMEGGALVDWIYSRVNDLLPATKEQLGVGLLPQIIA